MSAYQGSWAAIFAAEATRQALEDLCPSSPAETARELQEQFERAMENNHRD
jgi:hypothetical protein